MSVIEVVLQVTFKTESLLSVVLFLGTTIETLNVYWAVAPGSPVIAVPLVAEVSLFTVNEVTFGIPISLVLQEKVSFELLEVPVILIVSPSSPTCTVLSFPEKVTNSALPFSVTLIVTLLDCPTILPVILLLTSLRHVGFVLEVILIVVLQLP